MINKVTLVGRVGKDVELRYTNNGTAVANFTIATSEKVGEKEETEWHNIVAWTKTAENVNKYVQKGDMIYVDGRIKTRTWEKQDGTKMSTKDIYASRIVFMTKKTHDNTQEPPF